MIFFRRYFKQRIHLSVTWRCLYLENVPFSCQRNRPFTPFTATRESVQREKGKKKKKFSTDQSFVSTEFTSVFPEGADVKNKNRCWRVEAALTHPGWRAMGGSQGPSLVHLRVSEVAGRRGDVSGLVRVHGLRRARPGTPAYPRATASDGEPEAHARQRPALTPLARSPRHLLNILTRKEL